MQKGSNKLYFILKKENPIHYINKWWLHFGNYDCTSNECACLLLFWGNRGKCGLGCGSEG